MVTNRSVRVWVPHTEASELMGELPEGVVLDVFAGGDQPPEGIGDVEFYVPPFLGKAVAPELLGRMTKLRVVQALSAGVDAFVGQVPEGVTLCDARGVHDLSTAEWVVTAILSSLRDFPTFALAQAQRRWAYQQTEVLGGKKVLIVGFGSIGAAIEARLSGFEVEVRRVAMHAREGVAAVEDLPELLPWADVVVLIVPMTPQTRGLVDAGFLAHMRDGALLVNAARGPVVVTGDLLAELSSGRLRAALDVTDPEPLPSDHPLWDAPGLLLTPHVAGSTPAFLPRVYRLVRDQIRRYAADQPLANVVSGTY